MSVCVYMCVYACVYACECVCVNSLCLHWGLSTGFGAQVGGVVQIQQVLREVEEDYRKEVLERLVAMGRAVPKGVDPLDIVLEPEESRCFGGGVWK